uniref:Uncharacterized protein n=1 Tax=Anopheles melas TaxID=34690 RepID=A0A182TZV1_9DIPT
QQQQQLSNTHHYHHHHHHHHHQQQHQYTQQAGGTITTVQGQARLSAHYTTHQPALLQHHQQEQQQHQQAVTLAANHPPLHQPQQQHHHPVPVQILQTVPAAAPPIVDPLPQCLDANGTYLCTSYNPRCYIIQKLTPTPVSCITYEVTPLAASQVAQPALLAATSPTAPTVATSGQSVQAIATIDERLVYSKTASHPPALTPIGAELTALLPSQGRSIGSSNQNLHYTGREDGQASSAVVQSGSVILNVTRTEANDRTGSKFSTNTTGKDLVSRKLEKDNTVSSSSQKACVIIHAPKDGQNDVESGFGLASKPAGAGNELLSVIEAIGTEVDYDASSMAHNIEDSVSGSSAGGSIASDSFRSHGAYRVGSMGMAKVQRIQQHSGAVESTIQELSEGK